MGARWISLSIPRFARWAVSTARPAELERTRFSLPKTAYLLQEQYETEQQVTKRQHKKLTPRKE
jgi:hypothetical protein